MTSTSNDRRNPPGPSTENPAEAEAVFLDAHLALLADLPVRHGDAVADIGPGAGSVTVALARAVGASGRVYAVDHDPEMLEAVARAVRAAGVAERVMPVHHDLDDGPPPLPEPVAVAWSSACVHHALDWRAAVAGLAGLLSFGGVLALAEGGLPARCLPWDVGVGRPGLEIRLDEAHNRWFTDWFEHRPGVTRPDRDWVNLLADAGLVDVGSRSALVDVSAPLPDDVRAAVVRELAARVDRARRFLTEDDVEAWSRLLDPADPAWLGSRTDLALLTALTVHRGRAPDRT